MGSFKLLIAAALLSTPAEDLNLQDVAKMYEPLAPSLRTLAVQWEILDPRELHHMLAHEQDFEADLKALQERYRELRVAPPLAEALRFPGRDIVNDLLAFNRAYRQDLDSRLSLDVVHGEALRAALMETDQLYRIWDLVRDARCEYYYVTVRRQALQSLRETVGNVSFYTGQLPPHVPVWRFAKAD
jgi:hypothetical protein